jgi:ABC-type sugar transport system substrate-binding protein
MRGEPTMRRGRAVRSALAVLALAALAALLAPAAAIPGVGGPGHGAHFRFAWLANDPANAYDNAILAGIEAEAARSQSTVDPYFAGFDPAAQLAQCQEALASGSYDGLLVIAASNTEIVPCVAAARGPASRWRPSTL